MKLVTVNSRAGYFSRWYKQSQPFTRGDTLIRSHQRRREAATVTPTCQGTVQRQILLVVDGNNSLYFSLEYLSQLKILCKELYLLPTTLTRRMMYAIASGIFGSVLMYRTVSPDYDNEF